MKLLSPKTGKDSTLLSETQKNTIFFEEIKRMKLLKFYKIYFSNSLNL